MLSELAKREGVTKGFLEKGVRAGRIVVVKNADRGIEPIAIGAGVSTKVNANLGASPEKSDLKEELEKVRVAVEAGADTVMDLSINDDVRRFLKAIIKKTSVPVGTVPIYETVSKHGLGFTLEDYLRDLEYQCRLGVDFVTVHSGITLEHVKAAQKRLIPVTSRGGGLLAAWMKKHGRENPLYTGYDKILGILREHEVSISLGDALRPGAIRDATDKAQIGELKTLGELTKRAQQAGVKVMVEGPGHVPLDQIEKNMKLQKKLCHNAPFYVLGPLVTDVGVGHDHITGAIGGAVAAMHGADFLCYVTPSEHLGLPSVEDVRLGVIASKIAAHAADVVKLKRTRRDEAMSKARAALDWKKMFELALDPEVSKRHGCLKKDEECTMCGQYCALKVAK